MIQKIICATCKREMNFIRTIVKFQEYYPFEVEECKQTYECPCCKKQVEVWLI